MTEGVSEEVATLYRRAGKELLLSPEEREGETLLDRKGIEALLPHRDPFLLVDRVVRLDLEKMRIAARYDLARAEPVLAGHFPGYPVWPGVLQVEAIGQAGMILGLKKGGREGLGQVALTHIVAARFIAPILPGGEAEILATVLEEGLFFTIVGQCLRDGKICSVAALSGLWEDL
jgi:3-hydroxyacyl-[acyl-carrier-protein] dehydratase